LASAGVMTEYTVCGCVMSGNSLTLITAAFLFALITAVQYVFAKIANSLALEADCLSMGVDSLTYIAALAVECMREDDERCLFL
jgi:Co/Zn/Cd efflux system component